MKLLWVILTALLLLSQLTPGHEVVKEFPRNHNRITLKVVIYLDQGLMALLPVSDIGGGAQKCWNLRGKCRRTCFKKEKMYVYCTNSKPCCVKFKFQPKISRPWSF